MKKFGIQAILLIILIFGALYLFHQGTKNLPSSVGNLPRDVVVINGVEINIEVANTPSLRSKGLGGRVSLATNSGMLFVFENENTPVFWMKGLNFPLDLVWIRNNKIVDITKNVFPPSPGTKDDDLLRYIPREPVTKVLELNSGFVDHHGIKVGDKLETHD